jgi:hypothetical protein
MLLLEKGLLPVRVKNLLKGDQFYISSKPSCQLERTKMVVLYPFNEAKGRLMACVVFLNNPAAGRFEYPEELKVQKIV